MKSATIAVVFLLAASATAAPVDSPALNAAWQALDAATPKTAAAFPTANTQALIAAAQNLELRTAEHLTSARRVVEQVANNAPNNGPINAPPGRGRFGAGRAQRIERIQRMQRGQQPDTPASAPTSVPTPVVSPVSLIEPLLLTKQRVDALFHKLLELRGQFATISPSDQQRTALRNYLRTLNALVDLSGKLRYLQFDALNTGAEAIAENPAERERLVALLTQYRSTIGATVMVELLFDPEGDPNEVAALRASDSLKSKTLALIAASQQSDLLPELAEFALDAPASPSLVIQAVETIRSLGLPQDPRPGQDPTLPPVAITAIELRERLAKIPTKTLDTKLQARHAALLTWLDERIAKGVTDGHYSLGGGDFAPGDWLLMRNPSPYNLFTDISPGLFTHVGVVASETDPDGITRLVLVDLPERGTRIPATTVDTYVKRTRHYLVLRHEDPEVARKMAEAAAEIIGNESQFDLVFKTDRVSALVGKPLKDQKIHTYCAGLLLLCGLQAGRPREEFFPVAEIPAGGHSPENLKSFGMSLGDDFISPSGAIFSPKLKIVAEREPMYDPRREVEEAVYDYFAEQLVKQPINVSADAFQLLRLKVAEAAKTNPLLAQAIATAANVSTDMDLVSASKAAAVVEILDQAAQSASTDYLVANHAMRVGGLEQMKASGMSPEQIARANIFQKRHADLLRRWQAKQVSSRGMRIELVNYYVAQGRKQLDDRFFKPATPTPAAPVSKSK